MEKPLRSKKKRLIKKQFKKHGVLPVISIGKVGGLYWYKCVVPRGMNLYFSDNQNKIVGVQDGNRQS